MVLTPRGADTPSDCGIGCPLRSWETSAASAVADTLRPHGQPGCRGPGGPRRLGRPRKGSRRPGAGAYRPSRSAYRRGQPDLRRLGFSYALCCTAELGIWIALLIYAYADGGTAAGATIVLVQLVPCIVLGPFLGAVADVRVPQRVLVIGMVAEVVSMGAVAGAMAWGAPEWVVLTLAPTTALSITLTRPTQAALFPAVVRTPEELTAANVMSGWTYGVACLVGPALAGASGCAGWDRAGRRWLCSPRRPGRDPRGPVARSAGPRAVLRRTANARLSAWRRSTSSVGNCRPI